MDTKYKKFASIFGIIVFALALAACSGDNDLEDAADEVGDAIEKGADNAKDAAEDAADAVKDATN